MGSITKAAIYNIANKILTQFWTRTTRKYNQVNNLSIDILGIQLNGTNSKQGYYGSLSMKNYENKILKFDLSNAKLTFNFNSLTKLHDFALRTIILLFTIFI